jgi:general stress protein 26
MTGTSSSEPHHTAPHTAESEAEHSLESLVHEGDVVMLTTEVDGHLSSRPLTVAGVGGGTLLFLVDAAASWVVALPPADEVNASVATRRNDWVSVTGPAVVSNDPEAITRLWSPAAGAYFDGADDERIRVLQLHMEHGEFWSAPGHGPLGRLVAVVSAAIGADTGSGDRGQIAP